MNVILNFYLPSCKHNKQTHIVDQQFILDDMRRDIVLDSSSDNTLRLRFRTYRMGNDTINITGDILDLIVKEKPTDLDSQAVVLKQETLVEDIHSLSGKAKIEITKDDTANLVGNYIYELRRTRASDGKVSRLCYGTMSFAQSLFGDTEMFSVEKRATFTNSDLTGNNLIVTHGFNLTAPYTVDVVIFNNNNMEIIPDNITGSQNSVNIDLTSFAPITGTWEYLIIK